MDSNLKSSSNYSLGKKGLPPEQTFFLPEGYFQDLEDRVQTRIAVEDFESSARGKEYPLSFEGFFTKTETGFKSPSENYFDTLSTRIFSKIERQEYEIESLDPLLNEALKNTHFFVPETYFNQLSDRILAGIEDPDQKLEKFNLERRLPFQVPQDYFSGISDKVSYKLKTPIKIGDHPKNNFYQEAEMIPLQYQENSNKLPLKSKTIPFYRMPVFKILVAASISLLAIFSGIRLRQNYQEKLSYPILSQEDRLKYRFGIDESVLEDELVSDGINESGASPEKTFNSSMKKNDQYLLSHPDANTLLEEL